MELLCFSKRWHLPRTLIMCVFSMSTPIFVSGLNAQDSAVQKELNRRIANAQKANDLLKQGDFSYKKTDYKSAVKHYSQAYDLLAPGAMTHEIRQATSNRYATAATERARALAKAGNYDQAKNLLKTVLNPEVAPSHMGALKLLGQIDSPIRYNHALTPGHVKDVVKVGRLLREAQGFHNLGKYDRAHVVYQNVLQIDPYNKAARRGLEKIESAKSDYYRAAKDHTRASMLADIDKSWGDFNNHAPSSIPAGPNLTGGDSLAPDIRVKLASITVKTISLDNASIEEALDFVRLQSKLGDIPDAGGEQAGANVVLNLGDPSNDRVKLIRSSKVNLKLSNLPLTVVLDYITDQTYTQWRTDGLSVLVTPRGSTDGTMVSRSFRVPPNFLSKAAVNNDANNDDLFGQDNGNQEGKIAKKISITDFLKQNGVSFPDGATATYAASTNTLLVKNTPVNIDIIDQLVTMVTGEEPIMVVVKTKIIRVSEQRLKELGFDWVLSPWAFGRKGFSMGGGTVGNGTALSGLPTAPFTSPSSGPITSGNRSGNGAFTPDSIDSRISAAETGNPFNSGERAPGIFTITGVYSGVQVQMMMRGLDNKKGVDVMVNPSTIARSGERAKIELIREFIYPTEYEPPELPNSVGITDLADGQQIGGLTSIFPVTPATPTAFETRNVGVTLEVEPTIGPNKRFIELSLKPEMVEFQGFVNYGSPIQTSTRDTEGNLVPRVLTANSILMPIFRTLRLQNSTLTIQDGATVVIGGLMSTRKDKVEDKVPLLGDIPIAGRLFRSEAERTFREAIIVTVNAELVDPTGQLWRKR